MQQRRYCEVIRHGWHRQPGDLADTHSVGRPSSVGASSRGFTILDVLVTICVIAIVVSLIYPSVSFGISGAGIKATVLSSVGAVLSVFYFIRTLRYTKKWRAEGTSAVLATVVSVWICSLILYGPYNPSRHSNYVLSKIYNTSEENNISISESIRRLGPEDAKLWQQTQGESARRVLSAMELSSAVVLGVVSINFGIVCSFVTGYERTLARTMRSRTVCIATCLSFVAGLAIIGTKVVIAEIALANPALLGPDGALASSVLSSPLLNDVVSLHAFRPVADVTEHWTARATRVSVFELALLLQAMCYVAMDRWVDVSDMELLSRRWRSSFKIKVLIACFVSSNVFSSALIIKKIVYITLYFPGGLRLSL